MTPHAQWDALISRIADDDHPDELADDINAADALRGAKGEP